MMRHALRAQLYRRAASPIFPCVSTVSPGTMLGDLMRSMVRGQKYDFARTFQGQINAPMFIFLCSRRVIEMIRLPPTFSAVQKQQDLMDAHIDFIGKDGDGELVFTARRCTRSYESVWVQVRFITAYWYPLSDSAVLHA